jgi:regulatory protein
MKITDIKAQVKTAGRYSVFVDGKYTFSLSDIALLEQHIRIGQEVSKERIAELKQLSIDDKLYGLTLRYLGIRPRSEWEIRTYLQRKQASPALADYILNKLSIDGYIDDVSFAQAWLSSRRLLRPTSKRKLQQELRSKRVPDEVISQVLAGDETDERQLLRELARKKRARYADDIKLMQYLVRQGFGYEDVKAVVREQEN